MRFNIENLKEIGKLVKELAVGLQRLAFKDNFEGFEAKLVFPATSVVPVRNSLTFVPSKYIILSQTGNGLVTKATTPWTLDFLYFENHGASPVTATVFIMR